MINGKTHACKVLSLTFSLVFLGVT